MPYGQTFRALEVTDGAVAIDIAVSNALSALMRTVACEIRRSIALCEKINLTQVDGLRKPLMRDGIGLIHYRFFSLCWHSVVR